MACSVSDIMEVEFLSHQCWSELLGWEWPKGTSVNVVVCAIKSSCDWDCSIIQTIVIMAGAEAKDYFM